MIHTCKHFYALSVPTHLCILVIISNNTLTSTDVSPVTQDEQKKRVLTFPEHVRVCVRDLHQSNNVNQGTCHQVIFNINNFN